MLTSEIRPVNLNERETARFLNCSVALALGWPPARPARRWPLADTGGGGRGAAQAAAGEAGARQRGK